MGIVVVKIGIVFVLLSLKANAAAPSWLENIFQQMKSENSELIASELNKEYNREEINAAKSYLLPGLSLNFAVNEGKETSLPSDSTSSLAGGSSGAGGAASGVSFNNPTLNSGLAQTNKGFASQLSATYVLFSGFIISENIKRAEIGLDKSKISDESLYNQKKSQLLQVLMEWQWLKSCELPIKSALKTMGKVQENSNKKLAKLLFGDNDRVDISEKQKKLKTYDVKITEGLKLTEATIKYFLPKLEFKNITSKKMLAIKYAIPTQDEIIKKYKTASLTSKIADLDIATSESAVQTAKWQKPYIPTTALSLGASRANSFSSGDYYDNWSASILINFNLYDGNLRQTRLRQAVLARQFMQQKKQWEQEKTLLLIQHQLMEARVSEAEYQQHLNQIQKKNIQLSDAKAKMNKGIATSVELSAAELDLTKARIEALDVLKKYYSATLQIATELNDLDKVQIIETDVGVL